MGTITKALQLLTHFSSDRGEIGLASFVRLTGGDKATVRRHLLELVNNGFLEQHPTTRSYRLGPAVLRLAAVRETHFPVQRAITPVVDRVAEELGELVHASLLQGNAMSPAYHKDPVNHGLRVIFDTAELLPLHATASGLTMLAFGPEGVIDTVLSTKVASYAPNTVIARSDLLHLVGKIQSLGYGFSDQYFTKEIYSFAMPFFGPDETAIGTLAVPIPLSRLNEKTAGQILLSLREGCEAITASCGGTIPQNLTSKWSQTLCPGNTVLHGDVK